MKKVLIAGATGYLGKYLVKEFKSRGWNVSAVARNESKLDDISEFVDEKVVCELTEPSSLTNICQSIDVVFSSVGITKQKDGKTFMEVDYQANKNLLDEAKKSGVRKFIYVSVFGANKLKNLKVMQAKLKFENELRNSGLDHTIIYPNGFFSDMLEYLQMAKKGKGMVIGSGENKINPIHGADLAEVCVGAVNNAETTIEVGGPEILTHNEILDIAFRLYGKKPKISRFPNWMKSIILGLMRAFTPIKVYGPLEFFMTVLSKDMVAPTAGSRKLEDYFKENLNIK